MKFAEEGAAVVVCDLKPEGVDAAVALVRARGAQVMGLALNVTDRDALDHMAAGVKERFGSIDVLVNNAGITKDARLLTISEMVLKLSGKSSTTSTIGLAVASFPWSVCDIA